MNVCVWNLGTWHRGAYLQGSSRDSDGENGHAHTEGKRRWKPAGGVALTTDCLACKAAGSREAAVQPRKRNSVLGGRGLKMEGTYACCWLAIQLLSCV